MASVTAWLRGRNTALAVALVLWAGSAVAGTAWLARYKQTPGAAAEGPVRWPSESKVPLHPQLPTLLMVMHPKCSCSRASVGELSRLMTRLQGRIVAHVLVVKPEGVPDGWERTGSAETAAGIPGVDLVVDVAGAEALRFGALTSGQTYLYAPSGALLFSGGITASRGHSGDNAGSLRIVDLVTASGPLPGPSSTPVFGCDVHDPQTL
jgi:hypothetical protein